MVTLEEHSVQGGFGSAVLECLHKNIVDRALAVKCIGVEDLVVEHGAPALVKKELKLDLDGIYNTIHEFYDSLLEIPNPVNGNGKGENYNGNGAKKPHSTKLKPSVNG